MPATSKAQQRLMAMAEHNPSAVSKKNRGVLAMSHEQLHDFASTKRKGLPARKKQPTSANKVDKRTFQSESHSYNFRNHFGKPKKRG